jgi:hypothetical protein
MPWRALALIARWQRKRRAASDANLAPRRKERATAVTVVAFAAPFRR